MQTCVQTASPPLQSAAAEVWRCRQTLAGQCACGALQMARSSPLFGAAPAAGLSTQPAFCPMALLPRRGEGLSACGDCGWVLQPGWSLPQSCVLLAELWEVSAAELGWSPRWPLAPGHSQLAALMAPCCCGGRPAAVIGSSSQHRRWQMAQQRPCCHSAAEPLCWRVRQARLWASGVLPAGSCWRDRCCRQRPLPWCGRLPSSSLR